MKISKLFTVVAVFVVTPATQVLPLTLSPAKPCMTSNVSPAMRPTAKAIRR
jgi:hypothetical protein